MKERRGGGGKRRGDKVIRIRKKEGRKQDNKALVAKGPSERVS